jgi:hypothetical protein
MTSNGMKLQLRIVEDLFDTAVQFKVEFLVE